ncbi:MAG: hypothetical protein QGD94_10750, partial [Planctomycetia bacterium]|nr:hypothetical protein [Planctomycetia bacterium]
MRFIIDGYNLLHAVFSAHPGASAATRDAQTARLLALIAFALPRDCTNVAVVFDGTGGASPLGTRHFSVDLERVSG